MRNLKVLRLLGLIALFALVGFVPSAQASNVNFACSGTSGAIACTGTVTQSGSNFSSGSGGIQTFNTNGPFSPSTPFTLTFNTATGTIALTSGSGTLTGTINAFGSFGGSTTQTVNMGVTWTSMPASVQAQLGTINGLDLSTVVFQISSGVVTDVSITITPTPEPGSLALLGSGLCVVGGLLRKKVRQMRMHT